MSAVLGSVGETATAGLLDPDVESILEEKNQLISRQYAEIERLQRELAEVVGERDALLCEVSKFKFEREMTDLKRLQDDRCVGSFVLGLFPPLTISLARMETFQIGKWKSKLCAAVAVSLFSLSFLYHALCMFL